jgi:OmpA-OmpF porin, OOP family
MTRFFLTTTLIVFGATSSFAQQKNKSTAKVSVNNTIPISNVDLGNFPYFKTLPNFKPTNLSDSLTIEQNNAYFYDGKSYFAIEGQVSAQILNVIDDTKKIPSEFQIIQEFDKIVTTLGGKKIYTGKLPEDQLQKISKSDIVSLASKHQIAPSAYYGVVEYVIKTPQKEVWIQLVTGTIASKFYNLFVVEKQSQILTTNINKQNLILNGLEKNGKISTNLLFDLDNATLLSESKDELLNIVGVFQAHPDWKLKIDIHSAPIGKPDYILTLTEKRAVAIKDELVSLGVNAASIQIKGLGDKNPLVSNDTEKGRHTNTRVEISKL